MGTKKKGRRRRRRRRNGPKMVGGNKLERRLRMRQQPRATELKSRAVSTSQGPLGAQGPAYSRRENEPLEMLVA
jgi:hypothetical protein